MWKTIQINEEFPDSHYLVYKSKQYPIKWKYFKLSSKYFSRNSEELKSNSLINIESIGNEEIRDETNLQEESIQEFINYVQHQPINVNNDNVISIHYLANKLEVNSLIKDTTEYIDEHQNELVFDLLTQSQHNFNFKSEIYETIISNNLKNYLDDERLPSLPISTIYRILSQYKQKMKEQKSKNEKEQKKLNDFLFKCLDKHGKEASILLSFFEIDQFFLKNLNLLMNEYLNKISFEYINDRFVIKMYEELKSLNVSIEQKEQEINNCMGKLKLNQINFENIENEYKKKNIEKDTEIEKLKNELRKSENKLKIADDQMKKYVEEREVNERKLKIADDQMKKYVEERERNERKLKDEISKLKKEIQNQTIEAANITNIQYMPNKEFEGIVKYLTNKTGGNIHDNGTIEVTSNSIDGSEHPKNLLDLSSKNYGPKRSVKDIWVCFDFKDMEIELSCYSIKSYNHSKNIGHIKSWKIEISNDGRNWTKIDEHLNSSELNGRNIVKTFKTQSAHFSRYIRFFHIGEYWGSEHYYLYINSIEFYGRLKNLHI